MTNLDTVLADKQYRRSRTIHANTTNIYRKNRYSVYDSYKRVNEAHIVTIILSEYKCSIKDALLVEKAILNISEKDDLGERFSGSTVGSYMKIIEPVRAGLFEEFGYESKKKKEIGYKMVKTSSLQTVIYKYLKDSVGYKLSNKTKGVNDDRRWELKIDINIFKTMSLFSQCKILLGAIEIHDEYIIMKLNHKQEMGNHGRRYNSLNEISREDREKIGLYGVDMESAIQVILLKDAKDINPAVKLPWTEDYITNKKATRIRIATLLSITVSEAKTLITAIYQGKQLSKKYMAIEEIFEEANTIAELLITTATLKAPTNRVKYATTRANQKLEELYTTGLVVAQDYKTYSDLRKRLEIRKKYMFFYWTYSERVIQDLIAKEFKRPVTLHDAVYSKDEPKIDVGELEIEIETLTNYTIKLEKNY